LAQLNWDKVKFGGIKLEEIKRKKMLTETLRDISDIRNIIYEYLGKRQIIKILDNISDKSIEIYFDKEKIVEWIPLIIYKISLMVQKYNYSCIYYTMYIIDINKIDTFFNKKIKKYFGDETVIHFDVNICVLEIEKIKCSIIYKHIISITKYNFNVSKESKQKFCYEYLNKITLDREIFTNISFINKIKIDAKNYAIYSLYVKLNILNYMLYSFDALDLRQFNGNIIKYKIYNPSKNLSGNPRHANIFINNYPHLYDLNYGIVQLNKNYKNNSLKYYQSIYLGYDPGFSNNPYYYINFHYDPILL